MSAVSAPVAGDATGTIISADILHRQNIKTPNPKPKNRGFPRPLLLFLFPESLRDCFIFSLTTRIHYQSMAFAKSGYPLLFEKQSILQHFVCLRGDCFGKNIASGVLRDLAMTSIEFVNALCKNHN
jgi:hypothetical protein